MMTRGKDSSRGLIAYDRKGYIEVGRAAVEYKFNLTLGATFLV
jgi:hypothetical protein